jgi:hypothetical protein
VTEACAACPSKLVGDAARLLAGSFTEFVPPDAQLHLLNAQRELLLAVVAIIEHNSTRTVQRPGAAGRTTAKGSTRTRPERVQLD